jgi:hypothetical protein
MSIASKGVAQDVAVVREIKLSVLPVDRACVGGYFPTELLVPKRIGLPPICRG